MQAAAERRVLTVSLCVIAVVAVLFFLHTARDLLVPIALAVLVSLALEPVVSWLQRRGLPRVVGAPGIVLLVLAVTIGLSYSLLDDAVQVIESLPSAARQARVLVTTHVGRSAGAVEQAAAEFEKLPGAVRRQRLRSAAAVSSSASSVACSPPPVKQSSSFFWSCFSCS